MTKKQKKTLYKIIISFVLFLLGELLPVSGPVTFLFFLASYLLVGYPVLMKAGRNILKGQVFDENFLMSLATIGAFLIGEYPEGVAVMIFYQIGELFEKTAVGKSRQSISDLMDICPDIAHIEHNGQLEDVDPEEVLIDDIIFIKPGEKVPLDGIVIEGNSSLDTSALTGESIPRTIQKGDTILSGTINLSGIVRMKVTKEFGESTVSRILDLVENASNKKAPAEQFITKFSRYYTPVVVIVAFLLAFLPPVILQESFAGWIHRGLIFLVISCPCALVISVPLSFFGGIGGASKAGILVKGSNYLEILAKTDTILMDKTGTLTKGSFQVTKIESNSLTKDTLLEYCAYAEHYSNHPISLSIKQAYGKEIDAARLKDVEEIAGHGVKAYVDDLIIYAGNAKLMKQQNISIPQVDFIGTIIYVAVGNNYAGYIIISDEIKPDAKKAISDMKAMGVSKTVLLTGDHKSTGEAVGKELGIGEIHTELLPSDKVDIVEQYLDPARKKGYVAFAGDGINDAPVLTRADVGIAMGGLGSDAAIEAADVVIMNDEPSKIATAIGISRKTLRIVYQNISFALAVKFTILILGAFGLANMWMAVFADVGVSVIAILNATRALYWKNN
ncbi:heavy metal translocating P-type ATPase [[Clostridium] polysaccharolyticum]|uniref:Cd2+/Zn2+-exporting ATPase n=1 Tax=[Clostridium] polysaccharolyticum TaxID=29364 RepID=A0A1I0DW51_9FIRM|nr:heavy metal translocating P-type ATPase [[Clostridium] polysaccharolyticum]SET36747.1 Cd2+/Zn2+-exporting ATPase [[Clostridium] polysaccharolyticum]